MCIPYSEVSLVFILHPTELGYAATKSDFTLDERRVLGANIEQILKGEKEAARAPISNWPSLSVWTFNLHPVIDYCKGTYLYKLGGMALYNYACANLKT